MIERIDIVKTKIIYIYDPLCGWCYGFSNVITKLYENYKDKFDWQIYSAGMSLGTNTFEISEAAEQMNEAIKSVENFSDIVFGDKFKNETLKSDYIYNSLKPSIALTVFKELDNENSIQFATEIQKALFYYGENLNELNTYLQLIKKYGLSAEAFSHKFLDPIYEAQTYNSEFRNTTTYGINNFPAIIAQTDNKNNIISRGYQSYEKISANFERLLSI